MTIVSIMKLKSDMLNVEQTKQLLGDPNLSDKDAVEMRKLAYQWAELAIEHGIERWKLIRLILFSFETVEVTEVVVVTIDPPSN